MSLCFLAECPVCVCVCVCVCSLQGSHHPNIIVGQLVSWTYNPVFSYPPFFMGHFYDYYFYQRLQAEVCAPGPPGRQSQLGRSAWRPKGPCPGSLGHQSLYLETNSTVTSWELGGSGGEEREQCGKRSPLPTLPPPQGSREAPCSPRHSWQVGNVKCNHVLDAHLDSRRGGHFLCRQSSGGGELIHKHAPPTGPQHTHTHTACLPCTHLQVLP